MKPKKEITLRQYTSKLVQTLISSQRERTAETYISATNSLIKSLDRDDITLSKIDISVVSTYEYSLQRKGLARNTISFYIRNLRAIYNRAVDEELIADKRPFRRAYTGTSSTHKRAVEPKIIRSIAQLDLSHSRSIQMAADIFLFSFYTRGMAFVDIASLKWEQVKNGYLIYRRRKTGQQIVILWEPCMQQIAERYSDNIPNRYIFPIIKGKNPRQEYLSAAHNINRNLRKLGKNLQLNTPLTLYVARHSWASIAYSEQIPIQTISRALGHNSESTTRIYLASIDNSAVDLANKQVLQTISF